MGSGASTNVKKLALIKERQEEDSNDSIPVWTRSNSDGCIVENLNSSKTKVDLLDQQVSEYKELLKASEIKQEEAVDRASTLEKQLAEVEGVNFELSDTISELQQQLESLQANSGPEVNRQLEEDLTHSHQQVEKLEMHVKLLEEQMASMRSKFRKKLRAANTEVTEAKQEASLKLYSLKDQIKQLEEENLKLTERLDLANSRSTEMKPSADQMGGEDSRTMVILELSNQVSAQEDKIVQLQEQLERRDITIRELTHQLNEERPSSRAPSEIGSRPPSGAANRPLSGRSSQRSARDDRTESSQHHRKVSGRSMKSGETSERGKNGVRDMTDDYEEVIGKQIPDISGGCEDVVTPKDTERTSSARAGKRRQSSTRERRKSGSQNERTNIDESQGRRSSERSGSAESEEGSQRRKRSSSRGKQRDVSSVESSRNGFEPHGNGSGQKEDLNDTETWTRGQTRISSAGSHDSAFHESTEEGTKSAPCSAGTSRHRRRLKAAQQRASSLETIDHSGFSSPKPPLRPDTNLYERDSGVGHDLDNVSSRSVKASDQDLDDLLQELMSDESPVDSVNQKNAKSNHGFGIPEEKIRSLLSDSTT